MAIQWNNTCNLEQKAVRSSTAWFQLFADLLYCVETWLQAVMCSVYLRNCLHAVIYSVYIFFLQETQDPSAVLWLDEIQNAILMATKDTQDALQCKNDA